MPRRYVPPYDLAAMQARVIERLEAGMTATGVARLPGFPSKATLCRWGSEDPGFAQRMRGALAWGRGVRREARNAAELYDPAKAAAFLIRVRQGEPVWLLVQTPGWPSRRMLNLWKRMAPDFAAELAVAVRDAKSSRPRPIPYDEATADQIILACHQGTRLREVLKAPGMPGWVAVRRWGKAHPEFAGALRSAQLACLRAKCRGRCGDTPETIDAVEDHIVMGGTLTSAGLQPGLPSRMTLYRWIKARPEFAQRIQRAQAWRDHWRADEMLDRDLRIAAEGNTQQIRAAMQALRRRSTASRRRDANAD